MTTSAFAIDPITTTSGVESITVRGATLSATLQLHVFTTGVVVSTASDLTDSTYTFSNVVPNTIGYYITQTINGVVSAASNIFTASTVPSYPTNVVASAGYSRATVSFTAPSSNGGVPITSYIVTSHPDNITATGTATAITVFGLSTAKSYTFTVVAVNSNGNSASSSDDSSDSSSTTASSQESVVEVNGLEQSAGSSTTYTNSNNNTVTTVTVDTQRLEQILASTGTGPVVTLSMLNGSDIATGILTGQMIKGMEERAAILEIRTSSATYTLPASQINIDAVSQQLVTNVELKDISVEINIAELTTQMVSVVANAAKAGEFSIVVEPIEFSISCTYNGETVDVSSFSGYVERTIAIPDGVDPSKITTGIVVKADGTSYHVPTKIQVIGGKYYAVINSLTNSTYTVVWHPMEFDDVSNHWAKDAINDMGSRMVISGVGNNNFAPDEEITRAEVAVIVQRLLQESNLI